VDYNPTADENEEWDDKEVAVPTPKKANAPKKSKLANQLY
jgi:hypothetical protein